MLVKDWRKLLGRYRGENRRNLTDDFTEEIQIQEPKNLLKVTQLTGPGMVAGEGSRKLFNSRSQALNHCCRSTWSAENIYLVVNTSSVSILSGSDQSALQEEL